MVTRATLIRRIFPVLAAMLGANLLLSQCQSSPPEGPSATAPSPGGAPAGAVTLSGAGATFPAPLYQRWFYDYGQANPNVKVSYQGVGSGAGIKQFQSKTVDFAASDVAMSDEEIAAVPADRGVVLLPMTAGSVVLIYNVPGAPENLKLSRAVYSDMFLGKIKNWNDPKIAALNPGVKLPDLAATVVRRADGSGTTGVFTRHLSAVSPEWKTKVGEGIAVKWPTGVGGKGNDGVTAQVQQNPGSIGYVEYGYATNNKLPYASLENKEGNYVLPTLENSAAALASVELPPNLRAFIADPPGKDSYPLVTYTWILAPKTMDTPEKATALKEVLKWCLTEGQKSSESLGYIELPKPVTERVLAAVEQIGS
ncbi:phosphate ABC transporter substrate-binding protein PstS [Gloeobacter violaceus]